jgi:hypothetical protein
MFCAKKVTKLPDLTVVSCGPDGMRAPAVLDVQTYNSLDEKHEHQLIS